MSAPESKAERAKAYHQDRVTYGLMFHLVRAEEFFKTSLVRKLSHFERHYYERSLHIAEGIEPYINSDWTGCARQRNYMKRRASRILARPGIVMAEKFRAAIAKATGATP